MTIKAIVFDLGKVICPFEHENICLGLSAFSPLTSKEIYHEIFASGIERDFDEGKISGTEFYEKVRERIKVDLFLDEFKDIWNDIFSLDQDVVKIVHSMRNYQRYLLSNTNEWHFHHLLEKFDILHEFDGSALSFKVGAAKPKQAIYQHILEISGLPAADCLYVDDIAAYVHAAVALGFQGIHFQGAEILRLKLGELGLLGS